MQNILKVTVLLMIALVIGCSNYDHQKVEAFLNDYEEVVEQWEASIADGEFTKDDSMDMSEIIEEMEIEAKELQNVTKWSKKQQERYAKLTERIMDAIFNSMNVTGGLNF